MLFDSGGLARLLAGCALLLVILCLPGRTTAHPDEHFDAARLAVHTYLLGMLSRDGDLVGQAVAESVDYGSVFTNTLGSPEMAPLTGFDQVDLDSARYQLTPEGVVVGPVGVRIERNAFAYAWSFTVAPDEEDRWRVVSVQAAENPPEALFDQNLAEQVPTQAVPIRIRDGAGTPVAARINIEDANGDYWPPRWHEKRIRTLFRDDVGGDVTVGGRFYAYVPGDSIADLPPGRYTMSVHKGMEYLPAETTFEVADGTTDPVAVTVTRWSDPNAGGWYSGDTHVHFVGDHDARLEAEAEGLNVINVLATKWGSLITDVDRFVGAPSPVSDDRTIVYVNQETRHGWLGHTIMLELEELVHPLSWGGQQEGVRGGYDYPAMAMLADQARAQGAMVTWAHFPFPDGELVVDVTLGRIDSVDLFTWGDAFYEGYPLPPGSPLAGGLLPGPVVWWYRFLNTGFRLPVTAGTDKMLNTQVVGSVRTYAQLGESPLDYPAWISAIRAGRTFVTTGPLLDLSVNGEPIGADVQVGRGESLQVSIDVQVPPGYPAEVLELVQDGSVVFSLPLRDGMREHIDTRITAAASGWVAARVRGTEPMPYQHFPMLGTAGIPAMAHTSPIYLTVPGTRVWSETDAAFLASHVRQAVSWAEEQGRYASDAQRAEVVALYRSALEYYAEQMADSSGDAAR